VAAEAVSDSASGPEASFGPVANGRASRSLNGITERGDHAQRSYTTLPTLRAPVSSSSPTIKLSIAMAAFNEERTILHAVEGILTNTFPCDVELIVIDDGSTDRTAELLARVTDPRLIVRHHDRNRGKGAALLSALALASGSYIIPFDADLEYLPEDVVRLLDPVLKGRCTIVYGARLFGYNTRYRSYRYAVGNKTLTRLANILYDACLSDLHTCLKLIPTDVWRSLNLREAGFGLDTEITAMLLRCGVRPFEVPVSYLGRSHAQGKKITWRDAVACVRILLRVRLRRRSRISSVDSDAGLEYRFIPDRPDAPYVGAADEASQEYINVAAQ
jgi:dolichol-phosphate hexosyltransferase